ncbi:MAG TPA: CBASS cGAMP-activated phospholipase [Bryobacteraceae bacterium]|nr:CBASS cGAMP-activated phospholipase [Bryobacteraceae bacterium]
MSSGEDDINFDLSIPEGARDPQPPSRRRQILALTGGGYRGLYSASFLELAENHFKFRVCDQFDLLIGTSIGGLIAVALALETPASVIAAKMVEHGKSIFPRGVWTKAKQAVFEAPYSAEPLKKAVVDTIGKEKAGLAMNKIDKPLAINAVNYTYGRPEIFRSRGLAGSDAPDTTVLEAELASTAAPTYFPPRNVGGESLIDGGLIANAPELLGVSEACEHLNWALDSLYVLAIGTAARRQGAALAVLGKPAAFSWVLRRRLFQTTLAAQEALAESQCLALLGGHYYRVDKEPAQNQVAAIRDFDLTSRQATQTLRSLATESWKEHLPKTEFRRFFG